VNTVSSKRLSGSHSDNRKSAIQNPKWVDIVALVIAFTMCAAVSDAQQPNKVARIGYLDGGFASTNAARIDGFRQGLRDLGYIEGIFGTSTNAANGGLLLEVELAAHSLHLKIQYVDVKTPGEFESAFRAAAKARAEAILVLTGPFANSQRTQITALAAKHRVPAIFPFPEYVEAGGLMSYGASVSDSYRRAATYVDKILKGAKPADLPVEQPAKFEFIINLKAAKQIGLIVPQRVLARADRVIK
jgi:ABC transporter substrate binding protein